MKLSCPQCGKLLQVPETSIGKKGKCPACQSVFVIEAPAAETPGEAGPSSVWDEGVFGLSGEGQTGGAPGTGPWPQQSGMGGFVPGTGAAGSGSPFPPSPAMPPTFGQAPRPTAYSSPFAAAAKSKLIGPAIGLIVAAGINLLIILARFAVGGLDVPPPPPDADPSYVAGYQFGAKAVIGIILFAGITNLVTLFGAIMMLQAKMRGLAVTGAILAMIPCISCCWPLGLGMGIWAMVVLNKPEVRSAFT